MNKEPNNLTAAIHNAIYPNLPFEHLTEGETEDTRLRTDAVVKYLSSETMQERILGEMKHHLNPVIGRMVFRAGTNKGDIGAFNYLLENAYQESVKSVLKVMLGR